VPDPVLTSAVAVADRHSRILSGALNDLEPLLPVSASAVESEDPQLLRLLDQFQSRFTRLQDHLGSRLFPCVLEALGEDAGIPMIDRLSLLERYGFLHDAEVWQGLRSVRNHLSHDYPTNPEELSSEITLAFEAARTLLATWREFRIRMEGHPRLREALGA
jgi:hypothetical protein